MTRFYCFRLSAFLSVFCSFVVMSAASARANTIYTYTSSPSTSCARGNCPSSLSITVDTDLAVTQLENLSDVDIGPNNGFFHVTSFSVSDGSGLAINSTNGGAIENFLLYTDGSGNITNWIFYASSGSQSAGTCNTTSNPTLEVQASTTVCNFGPTIEFQSPFTNGAGWYDTSVGTWSAPTPTPEPASVLLLGSGVFGAIGVMRRKIRKVR